jgi:hypothetical protein
MTFLRELVGLVREDCQGDAALCEGREELANAGKGASALEAAFRVVAAIASARNASIFRPPHALGQGSRNEVAEAVAHHQLEELEVVLGRPLRARQRLTAPAISSIVSANVPSRSKITASFIAQ